MADYNFKPSVDITGIARLMQQKAEDEQKQQNVKNEQTMQAITAAVEQGQKLASTAVDISRRKQFANALAASKMTPGATTTAYSEPDQSAVPTPSTLGPSVNDQQYSGQGLQGGGTIPVVQGVPQPDGTVAPQPTQAMTTTTPPTDNPASLAIRAGAKIDPNDFASRFAEQQFPDPLKLAMLGQMSGGGQNYINAANGEVSLGTEDKMGGLHLANGSYFPKGTPHTWQKQYAPAALPNQFGVPTVLNKNIGTPGVPTSMPSSAGTQPASEGGQPSGLPGLMAESPKLAENFRQAQQKAYPQNNPDLQNYTDAVAHARQVEATLDLKEPNQIALSNLAFDFAHAAVGGRLAAQELQYYQRGFSLLRKIKDTGYQVVAGDLDDEMRSELKGLAGLIERKSMAQGQRLIDSAKKDAMSQITPFRYRKYGLDSTFPKMDDLVASEGDISEPAAGGSKGGAVQLPGGFSYTVK